MPVTTNLDQATPQGWGNLWVDALLTVATSWHSRLQRGETYAQRGHVLSLQVSAGKLTARVQGSRSKPYHTTIEVPTFREHRWNEVIEDLAREARAPAMLLAGRMPPNIVQVFERRNLHLFPVRNSELFGNCNCPEKQRPCKHIAAVHFAFGEALQRDPFLLFQLRGADRPTLLRGLRRAWFGGEVATQRDEPEDEAFEVGARVMPMSADRFNRSPESLEEIPIYMRRSDQEYLILRRLGPPPSWSLPLLVEHLLGPVYDEAAALAMDIALDESRNDDAALAEFDPEEAFDDWGSEGDDDYDEDDGDDEEDGDELDEAPTAATRRPLPSREFAPESSEAARAREAASEPAQPAPSGASPPASFLLPKALGKGPSPPRTDAGEPVEEAQPERAAVLLRKSAAGNGNGPARRRGSRPESVSTADTPTPSSVQAPPPASIPGGADSSRSSVVANDPSRARAGGRGRKGRTKAAPAPVVVRRSGGADATPVDPPPVLESPAPDAPTVRRRAKQVEAAPSRAKQVEAAAPRTRRAKAPEEAAPSPPAASDAADADALEARARAALDAGEAELALGEARAALRAGLTETRLLLLAAAADAFDRRMQVFNEELDRRAPRRRSARTSASVGDLLLRFLATRYDEAATLAASVERPAWALVSVLGALALEANRRDTPSAGSALARVLDGFYTRGEDAFDAMENPPAPLGAWVEWTLKDAPPSPRIRRQLLHAAADAIVRYVATGRVGRDPRPLVDLIQAALHVLRECDDEPAAKALLARLHDRGDERLRGALDALVTAG